MIYGVANSKYETSYEVLLPCGFAFDIMRLKDWFANNLFIAELEI